MLYLTVFCGYFIGSIKYLSGPRVGGFTGGIFFRSRFRGSYFFEFDLRGGILFSNVICFVARNTRVENALYSVSYFRRLKRGVNHL